MFKIIILPLLLCLNAELSFGMQCAIGNKNVLSSMLNSCPGILDTQDKSYCCVNIENNEMYCCDALEFAIKSSWILLTAIIVCSLIVFCLSCLCCTCCPWYQRRHRGTIYGRTAKTVYVSEHHP